MFGTLVDYWALTGDDSYNAITSQAIVHQATENADFMPRNQTRTLGNDDQGFWGLAAMTAAENNFPNPPPDQPQWLALAQSLFNQWASRWDEDTCDGGLRWQILTFNNGYMYKNSISNGCFFNVAARLARYTGNATYAEWATKIYDWQERVGLVRENGTVHDGVHVHPELDTCKSMDPNRWSYNAGIFLHGAAVMYNYTSAADDNDDGNTTSVSTAPPSTAPSLWRTRVDNILSATTATFFNNSILVEQLCEPSGFCNIDQRSFKGYLTRWLAGTTQMAPHTYDTIHPLLESDAAAAAKACSGPTTAPAFKGHTGTACGFRWTTGGFDGLVGVGEQMNALSAVMYTLVGRVAAPVRADTGGTSVGNSAAQGHEEALGYAEITLGDRVAAGFLTSAVALGLVAGCAFLILGDSVTD
jgi:mannan endo-1,6-alpha-mannosidase